MWEQYPEFSEKIKCVEAIIAENLKSRNEPLQSLLGDFSSNGGKKLRPALTILAADFGKRWDDKVLDAAAGIEILHMATLIHNDIIDDAAIRRGKPTINRTHGDKMAVYMGDFLLTRAVMLLSKTLPEERLEKIARGIKSVCEAEVEQFYNRFNLDVSLTTYLKRISRKTASLFAFSCAEGAFLSKCGKDIHAMLTKLGYYYGMAFQIQDDILNLTEKSDKTGKPEGDDILEGVVTLPFILALRKNTSFKDDIKKFFSPNSISREGVRCIIQEIKALGGICDAYGWIDRYLGRLQDLIELLPDKQARDILNNTILISLQKLIPMNKNT